MMHKDLERLKASILHDAKKPEACVSMFFELLPKIKQDPNALAKWQSMVEAAFKNFNADLEQSLASLSDENT